MREKDGDAQTGSQGKKTFFANFDKVVHVCGFSFMIDLLRCFLCFLVAIFCNHTQPLTSQ